MKVGEIWKSNKNPTARVIIMKLDGDLVYFKYPQESVFYKLFPPCKRDLFVKLWTRDYESR